MTLHPTWRWVLAFTILAGSSTSSPTAQPTPAAPSQLWDTMRFRTVGPAVFAGRVDDVAVYEADPTIFYVGTTTGGLWKTVNNGTTWEVLFNTLDDVVGIGDVTVAQDDPDLVWVGTGGTQSWGKGVYKSVDGGKTWQSMGLADTKTINRIVLDPRNHDVVFVAAVGHLHGPNRERGLFKSTDGGKTWQNILFVDEDTGVSELVLDPSNPDVLYAATYQRRRTPFGANNGGPESAIRKSIDGGRTWRRLDAGLPQGSRGAIGIDIYPKNPRILYALVEHEGGKDLFRSDDAGESWRKTNEPEDFRYQGHRMRWFDQVHVDPNDDQRVYVLGVNIYMSSDGGRTFAINESAVQSGLWPPTNGLYLFNTSTHSDHRGFWINPKNSRHLISGSDGGICISYETGRTWDCMNNMDLAQVYHVGFDMDVPYRLYIGLHDNLGWGGPSAVRSHLGVGAGEWFLVAGGDGFVATADPTDSRTIYAESQNGNMSRVDRLTNERVPIRPEPPEGEEPYKWNFNTPMMISPHDPATLLMAANRLFRSRDKGQTWSVISPDLTARIPADDLSILGVPLKDIKVGPRTAAWGTIFTLAESPKRPGLYYTGADDGTVQVSRDGGGRWIDISANFPGLPPRTWVSKLAASRFVDGRVYASFAGHRSDDYAPYIYVSEDFGTSWRRITDGIPDGQVVHVVAEDHRNPSVLYAGTEFGLFVSIDRGESWSRMRANLPTVPIYSIALHPRDNDLILGTFGRGVWILDDLGPVQQAAEALTQTTYLFDSRPARQFNPAHDRWWMWGDRRFWGENPRFGAALSFYSAAEPGQVSITIRDASGNIVRTLRSDELGPITPGRVTRAYWNLRHEPIPAPVSQRADSKGPAFFTGAQKRAHSYREIRRDELNPLSAPFVLPGTYQASLSIDGRVVRSVAVTVQPDPLLRISDADRLSWHKAASEAHALQRRAYEAGDRLAALTQQVASLEEALASQTSPGSASPLAELSKRVASLRPRLTLPVPGGLGGDAGTRVTNIPGQLASVKMQLLGATAVPTAVQRRTITAARAALTEAVRETNAILRTQLPAALAALQQQGIRLPALDRLAPLPDVTP